MCVLKVTLGLDSFGFVELGGRIKKHFGIEVNSVKMTPDNTLEDVSKIIYKLQVHAQPAPTYLSIYIMDDITLGTGVYHMHVWCCSL